MSEAVVRRYSVKTVFLKISQNSQENRNLLFNKVAGQACSFIKKEILAQVLSCEFCDIFKNTFSYRKPPVAASVMCQYQFCPRNVLENREVSLPYANATEFFQFSLKIERITILLSKLSRS